MAGGMQIRWNPRPESLVNLAGFAAAMNAAGAATAAEYESWAKQNRPWTDRTGAARASLTATHTFDGGALVVTLVSGVWYSVYLEYAHGGRWAVLPSATAHTLPFAIEAVTAALAGAA